VDVAVLSRAGVVAGAALLLAAAPPASAAAVLAREVWRGGGRGGWTQSP